MLKDLGINESNIKEQNYENDNLVNNKNGIDEKNEKRYFLTEKKNSR
jgi:hypothetical protein